MVQGSKEQPNNIEGISSIGLDPNMLTPLQRLVLEEIGKILGATARKTFTTVKERSGRLPTGRTLLGSIIDPLGLFQSSNLVETDDADLRVLEAAGKLMEILQSANSKNGGGGANSVLQNITPADARKLASSVSRRLWEKRTELTVLTGHLAYVMLRQTARRLEKPKVVKKKAMIDLGGVGSGSGILSSSSMDEEDMSATAYSDSFARPSVPSSSSDVVPVSMSESERLARARIMLLQSKISEQ